MRKNENRLTGRVALALLASMVTLTISAQMPAKRPTLVVGVMVDGLTMDNINLLKGYFGEGGFKRLLSDGVTITDVDYGTAMDNAAATAMVFTGAEAAVNGIGASVVYDRESRRTIPVFNDITTIGNYTDDTVSPAALLVSSLGDEVRMDAGGLGYVYSVSPDQSQSIIMAGHAGNSAFWINDVTGNWATTTYYKDPPGAMITRNRTMPLSQRLDTLVWTSSMPLENYPDLPSYKKHYQLRNTFSHKNPDRYKAFKISAPVNREVTSIALDYIKTLSLGKRDNMDMLNLNYTVTPYFYSSDPDSRLETMDSYIKLDHELARLFSAIDTSGPGMNNTLVFVTGTPPPSRRRRDDERWNIPYGEFSPQRAISLLNVYLIAKYGNGEWVTGYNDNQIYLNHTLIKERNEDLKNLRAEAAEFMKLVTGVTDAYSLDDVVNGTGTASDPAIRRNTVLATSGDVFFTVAPGWEIITDLAAAKNAKSKKLPTIITHVPTTTAPAFLLTPLVKSATVDTPVDARAIAPTVARLLRIRSPNGASVPPLRLK